MACGTHYKCTLYRNVDETDGMLLTSMYHCSWRQGDLGLIQLMLPNVRSLRACLLQVKCNSKRKELAHKGHNYVRKKAHTK